MRMFGPRITVLDTRVAKPSPKEVDPFYLSKDYRIWREAVIKRAGGRCQYPGCDRKEARMFADHIVERKDNGAELDPSNGQCLCGKHHTLKTSMTRAKRMGATIPS